MLKTAKRAGREKAVDIYVGKSLENDFEVLGWEHDGKYQRSYACTLEGWLRPQHQSHQCPSDSYSSIEEFLKANKVDHIRKRRLRVNEFHPRMFRPFVKISGTGDALAHANTVRSVGLLNQQLENLFESVYPHPNNLGAYGDVSRNLLLLACLEVEAAWAGVLRANGYLGDRLTTNDYYKVHEPLLLRDYFVTMPLAPHVKPIFPFKHWNSQAPTKSLDWYDAYNKTKHDREKHFSEASTLRAVTAVAAANITCQAQFGNYPDKGMLRVGWNYTTMPADLLHLCHGGKIEWNPVHYPF